MRERAFPSTFEDDESELLDDDTYDEHYMPPSLSRGRSYGQDISRSRSHSLATPTTRNNLVVGSPYNANPTPSAMQSWNESYLSNSNPLAIPGGRGYDAAAASRYGSSLGAIARSPSNNYSSPSVTSPSFAGNGYSRHQPQQPDVSNMSPFRRDVAQILLDDGPFRELWAGMNPPRDEGGGTGSGTTSRRHSVSVVQPRRGTMVGFNAPGSDSPEEHHRTTAFGSGFGGRSGLMLDDDDLASDLGALNLNPKDQGLPPSSSRIVQPPSQPASLPIYAPLSRSPPSKELFHPMLNIPSNSSTYSRQIRTPSDGGLSAGGNGGNQSPTLASNFYDRDGQYYSNSKTVSTNSGTSRAVGGETQGELMARYVPGQGIQYINTSNLNNQSYVRARAPSYTGPPGLTTPVSPTSGRLINPQQQPYYPQAQAMQRRASNAHESQPPSAHPSNQNSNGPPQNLNELGKGVPLHAIPSSCPLYIVEFKAGRTDLFYTTDSSQNIQIGDLVVVEADRGKDLGTVVNDTITLGEVEAFQKQQAERNAAMGGGGPGGGGGSLGPDGQPVSPTVPGATLSGGKKDIHPKMIYGKAGPQDTQTLAIKQQDEAKALQLCQSKVRAKKLPMEVIDAEYQWDRRKLTFYFVAEKRIDFRELVRELFRLYKTRIWMASLQGVGGFDQ